MKSNFTNKNTERSYLLFMAPAFLLFTVFLILPAVFSLYYSFTSWNGISDNINFIGLRNYQEIFTNPRFYNALKNTIFLTVFISVFENVIALALALLVDKVAKGKNFFRSIFYIPVLISGIVAGFIWKILYNYNFGVFNTVLDWFEKDPVHWIDGTQLVTLLSIGIVMIWKGAGYYMVIFLASLQGVPTDVLEAADIDGASSWQKFKAITIPLISGAFTINFTLALIRGLKVFDEIAVMTDGGPGFATETIVYLLYKVGFGEGRQGFGTAVGVVLLVLIVVLNTIQQKVLRKREVQL
ncbi:MAG: carbohydrate ABC transporter permease [Lachnospirales bacterium]